MAPEMGRRHLLVGDVGGTHASLRLLEEHGGDVQVLHEGTLMSQDYSGFDLLLDDFLAQASAKGAAPRIDAACFSMAGPVEEGAAQLTNLGWRVDSARLGLRFGIRQVALLNDFAAAGLGIALLEARELLTLQSATAVARATRVVLGAGTGLGMCVLNWENGDYVAHASEGGHVDFAPVDETQDALLVHLRKALGRVSCERVLSGGGLVHIFDFLRSGGSAASSSLLDAMQSEDPAAAIARHALAGLDALAGRALDLFVEIYGQFAGNVALTAYARGGVYIAGGIAHKIRAKMIDGSFMRAFNAKGRFSDLMRSIPVHVVLNEKLGVLGATRRARQLAAV